METWQAILAAGAAVAGVLAWLGRVLQPWLPLLCEVARRYIARIDDEERREFLLMLVRAAEEQYVGTGRGKAKFAYVQDMGEQAGYEFADEEIHAAAREITKEQPCLPLPP